MGAYLLKFMRWCWGGFWAGMIKGTPGAKLVRFLPWFVPEMTRYVVQVAEREVSHRLLTSGPAVTFFQQMFAHELLTMFTNCSSTI